MPREINKRLRVSRLSLLLVAVGALIFSASMPCSAQIPGLSKTVDGAFDRFNDSIERARLAALSIADDADNRVKTRLQQVDDIASRTINQIHLVTTGLTADVERILAQATEDVNNLRANIMQDVMKVIRETECALSRTLQESLVDSLGAAGRAFGTNEIEVVAPPLYDGEREGLFCRDDICRLSKKFSIARPYSVAYRGVKTYLLDRLDLARDDTPRSTIVDTFSIIAGLARKTSCFMPGEETYFTAEYVDYVSKARVWDIVPQAGR